MGMIGSFLSNLTRGSTDPQTGVYNRSPLDVGINMLFGSGGPADVAQHLRENYYQNAVMRPMQMRAMRDWMGYMDGGDQGAQPQQQQPDPSAQGAPAAVGGAGSPGVAPMSATAPLVPQAGGGYRFNLNDPRAQRAMLGAAAFGMPGAKEAL